MSVAVSCNLSEGVIIGVDSAVTVPSPGKGVSKVYENAEKLFQLGEKPIGIGIYGLATIGNRNIGSYIREFEVTDPGNVVSDPGKKISDVVEELRSFFWNVYSKSLVPIIEKQFKAEFDKISKNKLPAIGLVVGGFNEREYLSEVWNVLIPHHIDVNSSQRIRHQGDFGTNWFATFEPIRRYIVGFDYKMLDDLLKYVQKKKNISISEDDIKNIETDVLRKYEYQIPFFAMPINEGVDHVRFLVELVINHHRYVSGAPIVGGEATLGLVTYRGEKFRILE